MTPEERAARVEEGYHDVDGQPVPLETLCRREPEWAASRIRAMRAELDHVSTERDKAEEGRKYFLAKLDELETVAIAYERELGKERAVDVLTAIQERDAERARAEKAEAKHAATQAMLDECFKTYKEILRERDAALALVKQLEDAIRSVLPEMKQSSDDDVRQLVPGLACLYADVTPASSVAPEVAVLRENNEALGLKVQELEAEAAAMREALELDGQIQGFDCPHDAEHRCRCGEVERELWRKYEAARDRALASDAGRDLLERLARVEKDHANDLADLHMVARHCSEIYEYASGGIVTKPNTLPSEVIALSQERESRDAQEAAAQALEEAAQVAESHVTGTGDGPPVTIAAAIRAKKTQ